MGEPVAGGSGFDDLAGEGESVNDGGAESWVGEGRGPAGERLVGGDRDRGALLPFGEDLEERFGAAQVVVAFSPVARVRNDAAFAALAGTNA